MTDKRFTINMEDECIDDAKNEIFIDFNDRIDFNQLCELLNELADENERLTDKLNNTALELVDCVISMGKAVEISEMSYHDFINYRAKNGKPMELQL